ncbi:MAG: DUF3443 domain-containing protein [Pseudomonadota bacterium]|nr:DUF3443 domain-containing protein [Pseudomonadota bacterium]
MRLGFKTTLPKTAHAMAALVVIAVALAGCIRSKNATPAATPAATLNTVALTVDSGPAADPGQFNHAYVTVKVCAAGSTTQCANIDHVLLDTGSWGLRLVRSVLTAGGVTLSPETDAQGQTIEECVTFRAGQTWGPVARADITLAGEVAAQLPVQIMDDTGAAAAPPATCGANGLLLNAVTGFNANGLLGVGVFAQDCGPSCVNASAPLPMYYGCTAAGVCTPENVALTAQVTNPVALFAADNNGVIVRLPSLVNANGDTSVQGELLFGIATQSDNALPTGLTVLGADSSTGDFNATYNGGTTVLPALIDSGAQAYLFDDPTINACTSSSSLTTRNWLGYYCPLVTPQILSATNAGVGANNATNTVSFTIADPSNTFVADAAAYSSLAGGGGSTRFTWGMPFFYGRKIYVGIDARTSGPYTGPFYAY